MITVLKLLYGPKNAPTATLDLNQSGRKIYMRSEGFSPAAGQKNINWSEINPRADGQRRNASSRGNAQFSLTYGLDSGSSVGEVQYWQSQIHNFVEHVRQFEERRVGSEIWLQYLPETNLSGITEPTWGLSLHRYIRVRDIEVPSYPRGLHGGILQLNYAINDVIANITTDPYAESLEIEALACTTIPTGTDDADLQITLDSEFVTTYTVACWIRHRNSNYVAWEYYVDANNYLRLDWNQTNTRYELVQRRSGTTNTRNFSTQTLTNGAWVHVSVYYDGTTTFGRVNGAQQLSSAATATYSSGGTFYAGEATSVATTPNNNLDALRIFNYNLSSTQSDYIYANESPIKSAGNNIALVTYCKTRATRQIDAVDGVVSAAAKDNYAVIGNVPGDTEALTRIEFDPPSGSGTTNPSTLIRGFWLSRNAQDSTFTPLGNTFIDFSGTADSGNSSGDAYKASGTSFGGDIYSGYGSLSPIRGDVTFVGRLSSGSTNPITVKPLLKFGRSPAVVSEPGITMLPNDTMRLRRLGSMRIDWPQSTPSGLYSGVRWAGSGQGSSLLTNLVSWWNFDQLLGEPVEDKVSKNHLTRYQEVAYYNAVINQGQVMLTANSGYYWCQGDDLNFDGSFHFVIWVTLIASIPAQNQWILGKWSGAGSSQYFLYYNYSLSRFAFALYDTAGSSIGITATSPSPAVAGSTYMIDAWHTNGSQVGMRINNGTKYTAAHTAGVKKRDQIFSIGDGANMVFDLCGAWNRNLTDSEVTALYNSGNGVDYPFISSAINLDFVNILTEPTVYAYGDWPALGAGDTVVLEGLNGWVEDASDSDYQQARLDCQGNPITLLPGKYNYLTMLLGAENDPYTVSNAVTNFKVYVTPRWHLL